MLRWICLCLLLVGCGEEPLEEKRYGPLLPDAVVSSPEFNVAPDGPVSLHDTEIQQQYADVLEHPWIKQQEGLRSLTPLMVEDIRSLRRLHTTMNQRRSEINLPTTTWEQESAFLTSTMNEIQKTLEPLALAFPPQSYSVLNIPSPSPQVYSTPLPFEIYRREVFGQSDLGLPIFLDARVFDLRALENESAQDAAAHAILRWHMDVLRSGEKAFQKMHSDDSLVLLGHGQRDEEHFSAGHGFASQGRGVYLAFFREGGRLIVLHLDAPWEKIKDRRQDFLRVVNRQLLPYEGDVEDFKWR